MNYVDIINFFVIIYLFTEVECFRVVFLINKMYKNKLFICKNTPNNKWLFHNLFF